ncbi:sphingomyelin phosphodiesterase 4, neutral membrane (neutral sphingomyelinase-3) [Mortierella sp. GBA30]|nr:sphingomyelin phosphodiesterase 4, neutral membrane (neutral sphingomyelinase-3) [Mortierella sp. GBA30]
MSFEGLERLLVGSVPTACANLTNHLNQCFESDIHAKSFYEFLPRLCEILYGSKESRGWLHLPMSKSEETPLYDLIRPRGVLMRFLISRCLDTGFIYEMLPDSLPKRTQSKLDPTQYHSLPPMYLSRVNLVKTTAPIGTQKTMTQITKVNLTFNMLEYFLFYFAYALMLDDDDINGRGMRRTDPKLPFRIIGIPTSVTTPASSRQPIGSTGTAPKLPASRVLIDGSFYNLYQEYLHYFLPHPDVASKPRPLDIFNDPIIESSADRHQTQLSISEFFIGTLVELWLGQNEKGVDNRTIRYVQPGEDVAACVRELISHLYTRDVSQYVLGGDLMPTQVLDFSGKLVPNLVGMARRSAYQYFRPQLYTFLQLALKFWPLDDTFPRLIDTWLMWITPWRYGLRDAAVAGDVVPEKWQPFVFDNLLFYTVLLQLYLPRLSNAVQSSRSMAVPAPLTLAKELRNIQKVMKVYKAANLKEILKIAEQAIIWPESYADSSYDTGFSGAGSGRTDATGAFLASMVSTLQRQIIQLEGYSFKYEALFVVEGTGRSKIRMILTKLGNAVDFRQAQVSTLEAKAKSEAEQGVAWGLLSSTLNSILSNPQPKTVSQDVNVFQTELRQLRATMSMVGEVFDLDPSVVTSFEKQQQGTHGRGSTLTQEQLEKMIPPLEEEEATGLLGPEKPKKYMPRGLVKRSVEDIVMSSSEVEDIILSYEIEFLVKLTRRAEAYLTPKWHNVARSLPLPERVRSSKVHLRWLAAIPNLTFIGVILLAILSFFVLRMLVTSAGDGSGQRLQEPHVLRNERRENNAPLPRYDAHVQPMPVYRWEKPGQMSSAAAETPRYRPSRAAVAAEPVYTIDLQGI